MLVSGLPLTGCATQKTVQDNSTTGSQTALKALSTGVNIQFLKNSSQIDPGYYELLDATSVVLTQNPVLVLNIQGYTDTTGTNLINNRLSLARANSVRSALISNYGVNAEQLNAVGYGSSNPIASNDTEEGCMINRRVTLILNGQ